MRAVPSTIDASEDYVASFTGPVLRVDAFGFVKNGAAKYGYEATAGEASGYTLLTDAANCGVQALVSVQVPSVQAGPIQISCAFSLGGSNVTATGPSTASTIQVGGHNAYLPTAVRSLLIEDQGLPVTQSTISVTRQFAANGDMTLVESAPLMRCSVSDVYPPNNTSCPALVTAGVTFSRVSTFFRGGHQVQVRDFFTSTDHAAHPLKLQYTGSAQNETGGSTPAGGQVGFNYPSQGASFKAEGLGSSVTGFGKKAGTMLVRSDIYARSDDPDVDTVGFSWSRPPTRIDYSGIDLNRFGMAEALSVPASGTAQIGFALSEQIATSAARTLGAAGVQDMAPAVTITSHGGTVHGKKTTVAGTVAAGANGLPVKVKVAGHTAKLHPGTGNTEKFSATFKESKGKHTVKVAASDAVGNTTTASVKIKNT